MRGRGLKREVWAWEILTWLHVRPVRLCDDFLDLFFADSRKDGHPHAVINAQNSHALRFILLLLQSAVWRKVGIVFADVSQYGQNRAWISCYVHAMVSRRKFARLCCGATLAYIFIVCAAICDSCYGLCCVWSVLGRHSSRNVACLYGRRFVRNRK